MTRRRLALGLFLSAAAILASTAIAEVALRIEGYSLPVLLPLSIKRTYHMAPNSHFVYRGFLPGTFEDFANPVEFNQLGFHDREYSPERPSATTYRVMVLGDSYVAALEVPIEETFHKRLEARLRSADPFGRGSYEVIAFGQGNRAQEAELGWLRKFGPQYRPDLVLLVFFCGNDVMENSPVLFARAKSFGTRYLREVTPRKEAMFRRLLVFPRSRLNGLVAEALTTLYAQSLHRFHSSLSAADLISPELGVYRNPMTPEWRDAFERTSNLLEEIRAETERLGAKLIVASLSGPQAVGDLGLNLLWSERVSSLDYTFPDRWIAGWARDRGVPSIALAPRLAEAGRRRVFWHHDAHLTSYGHAVVTDTIYQFLAGSKESQQRPPTFVGG